MANKMDRDLDEIIADTRPDGPRERRGGRGGGGPRRPRRDDRGGDFPRDGVRKPFRNEAPRNIDSEWVHDRYEDDGHRRAPAPRRRESPSRDARGSKLRVEDIHYDVTEEELDELFKRIGPIIKLNLTYDRAGRSRGTAYVTYERAADAEEAIRQFDGANAYGQPIKVTQVPIGPSRNPFDSAIMPGKPLADRIGGRTRSLSPSRKYTEEEAARKGIDRYVPNGSGTRSRSPAPRRRGGGGGGGERGGRRPGAKREGQGGRREDGRRDGGSGNPRQKKTQEELDAEMADYFGGGGTTSGEASKENGHEDGPAATTAAAAAAADDVDMIE